MGDIKVKALLIGCSYEGQDCEMEAGYHDVKAIEKFIKDNFDWSATRVLHEKAPKHRRPTRAHIIEGFKWLVHGADPVADHLFVYFAGHGGLKDGVSHILPVDHEDEGVISAAQMRKELVKPLEFNQSLTAFFQHCHSGNSLEMPYICKKPSDLKKGNFTRTSFNSTGYNSPSVICFGASNLQLSAWHDAQMSLVTRAFVSGHKDNASILDVFKAMEKGDSKSKPEFSCSNNDIDPDYTFLCLW